MHEVGLCEEILRAVERRARGRRVTGVTVRIGSLHAVVEGALTQSFELVARGSVADGAGIELVTVPGDEFTLQSITLTRQAADQGAADQGAADVPRHPG
ncbi:hypothetical protein GCM10010365_23400 [Streptomyces poonensis]|uniref:Hydrogenase maturation nickel metallochaperone HypA n=1 Tax=Streptomyces poonensis TaxID=68255 RepID=A0A918PF83_9ACTN|nr:hypothetical protein GCM10010365_23400 [Streptomyces poonensis]GLJ90779.1 hypothetical protein GCM10017589_33840 [Streptomyces poonensis]